MAGTSVLRTIIDRSGPLALLLFGVLGLAGGWTHAPPLLLLAGFAWLPGVVAVGPCRAACAREGLACPAEGPGAIALAIAFSILLLVPAVLPLFVLEAPLEHARFGLGATFVLVAVAASVVPLAPAVRRRPNTRVWLAWALACAALLPAVTTYAGGTVDDWWDLAFVRAYAERGAGFGEPVLGTGIVHPRFAWNGWFVLQSLVIAFSGTDPAAFQAGPLAAFSCIATVSAAALLAGAVFGPLRTPAVVGSVLFVAAWLWGTDPLPFFTRLHQDKFVVALVLVPAMLATAFHYFHGSGRRMLLLLAVTCGAAASIHGVVFAVGALGVLVLGGVALLDGHITPILLRRIQRAIGVLGVAALYPVWQAWTTGVRFASQGIELAVTDNPVVRAHLWLDRLIGADSAAYVVNPAAVFGPVALVAAIGLALAARRRGDRAASALVALAVVPCALIFVPFLAAATGALIIPWMLYRVGWLVPVSALAGIVVEAAWASRGWRRALAVTSVVGVTLLLTVPVAADRVRRDMTEHPGARQRAPRGTTLAAYRFLHRYPASGRVAAPPGFASLVAAMSGRASLATSERGTLVFSSTEAQAYTRLRDRAAFLAPETSVAERARITREHHVEMAVFRRRLVAEGDDGRWLERASAEGFLLAYARDRAPDWDPDAVAAALPHGWRIVFENDDYLIAAAPLGDSVGREEGPSRGHRHEASTHWLDVFDVENSDVRPTGEVLASLVGYPGARVELDPVPIALGITDRPVWIPGGAVWDDGPDGVQVALSLAMPCRVDAVEVVPFLRTGRRDVFEISLDDRGRRLYARDDEPVTIRLSGRPTDHVVVRIRSMLGLPFALADVRLVGNRDTCHDGWRPPRRPEIAGADVGFASLEWLARTYPNDARAAIGLARRTAAEGRAEDAIAVLRLALARAPSSAAAWVELGLLEDAHGRFADAVVAYRRALRADSNSAWARGCLAWADLRRDWTLAALYQAWRAVRLDPRYSDAYTILAGATERLGLRARARALLVRAIELDVRRNWPYLELARMNVEDGRRGAAIDVLSRLLERVPDDERGRALLGELMGVAQSPALD